MFEPFGWFVDLSPLQQSVFIRTVLDEGRSSVVQATMSNLETFPEWSSKCLNPLVGWLVFSILQQ